MLRIFFWQRHSRLSSTVFSHFQLAFIRPFAVVLNRSGSALNFPLFRWGDAPRAVRLWTPNASFAEARPKAAEGQIRDVSISGVSCQNRCVEHYKSRGFGELEVPDVAMTPGPLRGKGQVEESWKATRTRKGANKGHFRLSIYEPAGVYRIESLVFRTRDSQPAPGPGGDR